MDSAPVPSSPEGLPALAGNVPVVALEFSDGVPLEQALQWHALGTHSWPVGAAGSPAATRSVRLSVDRAGLAPASLDLDGQGSQYQGLLLLTDGVGFRRWLGIRAQVLGDGASAAGGAAGTGTTPGLYFGHVTVDRVAWITAGAAVWTNADPNDPQLEDNPDKDTITLRPAPAAFVFPVIIHLSESGAYHLLTEVTLLFKPGDKKLGEPGQYVLATPACGTACDGLLAGSIQDGQPFARRFSSAAFVFDSDLPLSGSFAGMLEGQTTLATNHRLNPFHHRYHPDHDCNADGECFEIGRTFEFAFDSGPPPGPSPAGWGDALLGGSYAETITGLHKDPIRVSGRFDLRRVSNVAVLNVQN
jgi:hypothetical protein